MKIVLGKFEKPKGEPRPSGGDRKFTNYVAVDGKILPGVTSKQMIDAVSYSFKLEYQFGFVNFKTDSFRNMPGKLFCRMYADKSQPLIPVEGMKVSIIGSLRSSGVTGICCQVRDIEVTNKI